MANVTSLLLIRHAPTVRDGRLAGRRDVEAEPVPEAALSPLRDLSAGSVIWSSPARRCLATADTIWPGRTALTDARLWEQDFGEWEGRAYRDLPDIGPQSADELAAYCPPKGESFATLATRVTEMLTSLPARSHTLVVHAGTVRSALALAIGSIPAALTFEVGPLTTTRISRAEGGQWTVNWVNRSVL